MSLHKPTFFVAVAAVLLGAIVLLLNGSSLVVLMLGGITFILLLLSLLLGYRAKRLNDNEKGPGFTRNRFSVKKGGPEVHDLDEAEIEERELLAYERAKEIVDAELIEKEIREKNSRVKRIFGGNKSTEKTNLKGNTEYPEDTKNKISNNPNPLSADDQVSFQNTTTVDGIDNLQNGGNPKKKKGRKNGGFGKVKFFGRKKHQKDNPTEGVPADNHQHDKNGNVVIPYGTGNMPNGQNKDAADEETPDWLQRIKDGIPDPFTPDEVVEKETSQQENFSGDETAFLDDEFFLESMQGETEALQKMNKTPSFIIPDDELEKLDKEFEEEKSIPETIVANNSASEPETISFAELSNYDLDTLLSEISENTDISDNMDKNADLTTSAAVESNSEYIDFSNIETNSSFQTNNLDNHNNVPETNGNSKQVKELSEAENLILELTDNDFPVPYTLPKDNNIEVEPEPVMVEPEPVMVEPEPVMVEPEPVMVEPEPVMVEPEPVMVEPEPVMVEPEPVMVEPEPVMVEPEPVMVEPEPVMVEPEPVMVEPEPVMVEPEPVMVEPEPVMVEPEEAYIPKLAMTEKDYNDVHKFNKVNNERKETVTNDIINEAEFSLQGVSTDLTTTMGAEPVLVSDPKVAAIANQIAMLLAEVETKAQLEIESKLEEVEAKAAAELAEVEAKAAAEREALEHRLSSEIEDARLEAEHAIKAIEAEKEMAMSSAEAQLSAAKRHAEEEKEELERNFQAELASKANKQDLDRLLNQNKRLTDSLDEAELNLQNVIDAQKTVADAASTSTCLQAVSKLRKLRQESVDNGVSPELVDMIDNFIDDFRTH